MNQEKLLVIGNLAGDLDSTVSIYCESELQSRINPENQVIPLYARSSSQLYLTPEILAVFHYARIDMEKWISLSSPGGKELMSQTANRFFLVDHNKPEKEIPAERLTGIIDHHEDSGIFPGSGTRIIEEAGSCASLISRHWRSTGIEMSRTQALLLGAAITVDTGNFNPEWNKTCDVDRTEFQQLQKLFKDPDREFLRSLLKIKQDLSHLTFLDLLIRDYKEVPLDCLKTGICSIPFDQESLFNQSMYSQKDAENFILDKSLDFLIIMHSVVEPFRRELSLFCPENPALLEELEMNIPRIKEMECLRGHRRDDRPGWVFFPTMSPFCSRKKALPLIHRFLNFHELKKT